MDGLQIFDTTSTLKKVSLDLEGIPLLLGPSMNTYPTTADAPHNSSVVSDDTRIIIKNMTQGQGCNLAGHLDHYRVMGEFSYRHDKWAVASNTTSCERDSVTPISIRKKK